MSAALRGCVTLSVLRTKFTSQDYAVNLMALSTKVKLITQ